MTFVIWLGKDTSEIKKDDLISLGETRCILNGTHFE